MCLKYLDCVLKTVDLLLFMFTANKNNSNVLITFPLSYGNDISECSQNNVFILSFYANISKNIKAM